MSQMTVACILGHFIEAVIEATVCCLPVLHRDILISLMSCITFLVFHIVFLCASNWCWWRWRWRLWRSL